MEVFETRLTELERHRTVTEARLRELEERASQYMHAGTTMVGMLQDYDQKAQQRYVAQGKQIEALRAEMNAKFDQLFTLLQKPDAGK